MSARMASAIENRPPAPMPWTARNAASSYIEVENVQSTEPKMKMLMAVRNIGRRP